MIFIEKKGGKLGKREDERRGVIGSLYDGWIS